MRRNSHHPQGVGLIEALIALSIIVLIAVSTYGVVEKLIRLNEQSAARVLAMAIANEKIELARNLPFDSVGTQGGIPPGVLPQVEHLIRNNQTYTITTTVRGVDDPFDGTVVGNPGPVDSAPTDYKLIEVSVTCPVCPQAPPIMLVTYIGPNGLELSGGNGALFVNVIDALGQPVVGASVHITNPTLNPPIDLTDTTGVNGDLQLVDVPPSVSGYHIEVTQSGFSTDQTYPISVGNPNPISPDATVTAGSVTDTTFAIDRIGQVNISTINQICTPRASVDVHIEGSKLIGTSPDIKKFTADLSSDGSGNISQALEWDSYDVTVTDSAYDLIGTVGTFPIQLNPAATLDVSLILGSPTEHGLHITVLDSTNQQPVSDADVTISLANPVLTLQTGKGHIVQTDWSGNPGQEDATEGNRYAEQQYVDTTSTPGQLSLQWSGSSYAPEGTLTSSTYDTGGETNYANIIWEPLSQPPEVGTEGIRFQIATSSTNEDWDEAVFVGPDGTESSYYTVSNETVAVNHNGDRYFRYRTYLKTEDTTVTPILAVVAISFTAGCTPPGQVFFPELSVTSYQIDVVAPGYLPTSAIQAVSGWTDATIELTPQ